MAQRPRTSSAASKSSSDSEASVCTDFDDSILSEFQVDISEDNLSTLKAEERERVMLRDTKLAILNSNQFHWKAQNIWSRHLSLKHPSNEPQYSVKARLFLSRVNATPWEEQSCPVLQFISDCFRQLRLEDKHMVKTTPQFRKLIHILAPHVEREQQERDQLADGMLVQARLLEPGPLKVYHEPSIKKVSSSSASRANVRQARVEDGDDLDISMAGNSVNHPIGVAQSDVAMEITGGGTSRSTTQSTSFPAIGSVFGDTAGIDTHSFLDGNESDGLAQPRGYQDLGVPGPASVQYTQDFGVPGPASVQCGSTVMSTLLTSEVPHLVVDALTDDEDAVTEEALHQVKDVVTVTLNGIEMAKT